MPSYFFVALVHSDIIKLMRNITIYLCLVGGVIVNCSPFNHKFTRTFFSKDISSAPEYTNIRKKLTQSKKVYNVFELRFIVTATLKTQTFREAYIKEYVNTYLPSKEQSPQRLLKLRMLMFTVFGVNAGPSILICS